MKVCDTGQWWLLKICGRWIGQGQVVVGWDYVWGGGSLIKLLFRGRSSCGVVVNEFVFGAEISPKKRVRFQVYVVKISYRICAIDF